MRKRRGGVSLEEYVVATAGVVLATEEVVKSDLVKGGDEAYEEMWPPTATPGR